MHRHPVRSHASEPQRRRGNISVFRNSLFRIAEAQFKDVSIRLAVLLLRLVGNDDEGMIRQAHHIRRRLPRVELEQTRRALLHSLCAFGQEYLRRKKRAEEYRLLCKMLYHNSQCPNYKTEGPESLALPLPPYSSDASRMG